MTANSINISSSADNQAEITKKEQKLDKYGRAYGTGRRKDSVARLWIKPGKGNFTVNKKALNTYFSRSALADIAVQPLDATNTKTQFDIFCTVKGGGLSGQAGAIRHALSRALDNYNPDSFHKILRSEGLLTRDARVVERKHYGKKKARKSFQFSKR